MNENKSLKISVEKLTLPERIERLKETNIRISQKYERLLKLKKAKIAKLKLARVLMPCPFCIFMLHKKEPKYGVMFWRT